TDSDFYKWLEAACYALAYESAAAGPATLSASFAEARAAAGFALRMQPSQELITADPHSGPYAAELQGVVDKYADLIAKLQEPDGYIGTRLSPAGPFDERVRHDLYV